LECGDLTPFVVAKVSDPAGHIVPGHAITFRLNRSNPKRRQAAALQRLFAMPAPTPFDDGELYDLILGDIDYGNDFYFGLAKQANGPVLDVACGTGRILLPCLASGIDVEGVDLYSSMLDRLREKAAKQGLSPRLHQADMSSFRIDRQFALVMIPFNAFIHNMNANDQIGCLTHCREHLLPGGLLAFDTFFPSAEYLNQPAGTRVLEGESVDKNTGLTLRVYDTRTIDRVQQTQYSDMDVEFVAASGEIVRVWKTEINTRWMYKMEIKLLLRLAGFQRWEIYGGFDRRPLERETDAMIVCAWNA
jgi:2-polyprenyl-3-methyl-5-hydroxy-6-metoxy-1,4-benzoquinol methylase